MVLILITHVCGEDPFVLSSLSPIVPSSSNDLSWSSLALCLLLLCSVVHCLTLIPLLARQLWTYFLWTFLVCTRHVARLWYMCLTVGQHIGGSCIATTHYLQSLAMLLLTVSLAWSFSWYFGVSNSYYYHQQPDMIQPVVPPMSLVSDVYIFTL